MGRTAMGGTSEPRNPGLTTEINTRWAGGGASTNLTQNVNIAGPGSVSTTRAVGTGVANVIWNSTGNYTINLIDTYQSLDGYGFSVGGVGGAAANNRSVSLASANVANGTLTIIVTNSANPPALSDLLTSEEITIYLAVRSEGIYSQ